MRRAEGEDLRRAGFVITSGGELKLGFRHYLLSGQADNVQAAGRLVFDDSGKIISITNESGHYQPNKQQLEAFDVLLKEFGLDIKGARLGFHVPDSFSQTGMKEIWHKIVD